MLITTRYADGAPEANALLIDYGGVLTASVVEAFSAACASIGVDSRGFMNEAFATSHAADSPFASLELGHISEQEFTERLTPVLRRHASNPVDGHQFYAAMQKVTWDLDAVMTTAVDGLISAGVPTALVSNSWGRSETYPWDQLPAFTAVVVSSDVGLRKPDRDIYLLAADRIGIEPNKCVFVDDLEVNLAPARDLGMSTVLHIEAQSTITKLATLFGVSRDAMVRPTQ